MSVASNAFALLDDHHTDHHGDAPKRKRKSKSHKIKPITKANSNVCSRVVEDEQQAETEDITDGITLTANSRNPSTSHADTTSDQDVTACLQPVSSVHTNGLPHTGTSTASLIAEVPVSGSLLGTSKAHCIAYCVTRDGLHLQARRMARPARQRSCLALLVRPWARPQQAAARPSSNRSQHPT